MGGNFGHLSHSWYSWMFIPPVSQSYGNRILTHSHIDIGYMDKIDKIYTLVLQILSEKVWAARKNHPQIQSQKVFGTLGIDIWILTIVIALWYSCGWIYVTLCDHSLAGAYPNKHGGGI